MREERGEAACCTCAQRGGVGSSPWKPLSPGKPRKGVVSEVEMHLTTDATHELESKDFVSKVEMQLTTKASLRSGWRPR